jgi:hypothetical protein
MTVHLPTTPNNHTTTGTNPAKKTSRHGKTASKKKSASNRKSMTAKDEEDESDVEIQEFTNVEESDMEDPEFMNVALNCGYIIYKDQKDIIFYTNDLASTPNELVVIGNDDNHAIHCVNGPAKLDHWTDECMLNREVFDAPAVIVAHDLFRMPLTEWNNVDNCLLANDGRSACQ